MRRPCGLGARFAPPAANLGRAELIDVYRAVRVWTGVAALVTNTVFAAVGGRPELWLAVLVPIPTVIHGLRRWNQKQPTALAPIVMDATAVGVYITLAGLIPVTVAWTMLVTAVVAVMVPPDRQRLLFGYVGGWMAVGLAVSVLYDPGSRWSPNAAATAVIVYVVMPMVVLGVLVTWVMRRLRQVEEERKRLIGGFSHDMKNALTGAVGMAELVASQLNVLGPHELAEYAIMAIQESREALAITEDLLVLGRAEAGQLDVSTESVDLLTEATRVIEATGRQGDIIVEPPAQRVVCIGDPVRVRQILRNLVSNAIRYGGKEVRVSVGVTDIAALIRVADNGTPIPEIDRERIFDAYQRARHRQHHESVGLGLTISRHLARLMDGDLTYRHTGGWSIFELTLPSALSTDSQEGTGQPTNTPVEQS